MKAGSIQILSHHVSYTMTTSNTSSITCTIAEMDLLLFPCYNLNCRESARADLQSSSTSMIKKNVTRIPTAGCSS